MKCTNCKKEIDETFMEKIRGTYIKGQPYCSDCQKSARKELPAKKEK